MESLTGVFATVPIWLVWLVVVGIAAYWFLTRHYDHWKRVGVPYVSPVPLFGSTIELFANPMHDVELKRYRNKGRIYGTYEGRKPVLIVGEPDILRDILVKDFQFFTGRRNFRAGLPLTDNMISNMDGEDWKRVRTVVTPAFSTGKLKKMISIFTDSASTLATNLEASSEKGEPFDAKRLFGAFAMDVIASSAFATKIDSQNNPENPFVTTARDAVANPFPWRFALFFMFPGIMRLFGINIISPTVLNFFEKAVLKIVEERKRTKHRRNDFLQLLIDAVEREDGKEAEDVVESEETKEIGHEEANDQVFKSYQSNKSLSITELVSNSIVFFLAGYTTTATTLAFAAYELAVNPEVQDRLIAEIDQAIEEKGQLNYEALCEMKYLDNVISETLRKYPPAVRTDRIADEEYEIKDHNVQITVPKGMIVVIPIYAIHHDPQHYPDPETFDPDRFTHEQKSKRHSYCYIPFGAGPRNCVGMRFALMEIKVCLATLLSRCRLTTCSKTQVPMEFMRGQGLMQPKSVLLKVEVRSDGRKL